LKVEKISHTRKENAVYLFDVFSINSPKTLLLLLSIARAGEMTGVGNKLP